LNHLNVRVEALLASQMLASHAAATDSYRMARCS
jgi:hypothetical protein